MKHFTLKEFKEDIESFPDGKIFNYTLEDVFSWRGYYWDVVFRVSENESTKEDVLKMINIALTEMFSTYKDAPTRYYEWSTIHFEDGDYSTWSADQHIKELIVDIEIKPEYSSLEERFIKQAFI